MTYLLLMLLACILVDVQWYVALLLLYHLASWFFNNGTQPPSFSQYLHAVILYIKQPPGQLLANPSWHMPLALGLAPCALDILFKPHQSYHVHLIYLLYSSCPDPCYVSRLTLLFALICIRPHITPAVCHWAYYTRVSIFLGTLVWGGC